MATAAVATDKNKKKKKSPFAGLFSKKKKKDIQIVPIQYVETTTRTTTNINNNNNNLSTNQLAVRYDVTATPPDVIQSSNNISTPRKRQAPPPPTSTQGQGAWPTGSLQDASYRHCVSGNAMTSLGGSTTAPLNSRSSSRSSGFDEVSSSLTETSDVTAANKLVTHRQTCQTEGNDTLCSSSQATDTLRHNVDTCVDTSVDIVDGDDIDKSVIDLIGQNKSRDKDSDADSLDTLLDGDNYGHSVTSHSGDGVAQGDTEIVPQSVDDVTDDTLHSQSVDSEPVQECIHTCTQNSSNPQCTDTLLDVARETADDVTTAANQSEPLTESHETVADQSQSSTTFDPNQMKLIEEFSLRFSKLAERVKAGPLRTTQLHTHLSLRSLNEGSIDSQSVDLRPSTPCDPIQSRSGQQVTTPKIALNSAFRNMLTASPRSRGVVTSPCRPHATLRRSNSTALSGINEVFHSVTIATTAAPPTHQDQQVGDPKVGGISVYSEAGNDETCSSETHDANTSGHVTASPTHKSMTSSLCSLSPTHSDDVTHCFRPNRSRDQWIERQRWSVVGDGKGKKVDLFDLGLHSSATDLATSRLTAPDLVDSKFSLDTKKTAKSTGRRLQVRQDDMMVNGKEQGWNSAVITSQKGVEGPSGHSSEDEWPCPPSFDSSSGLPGLPGIVVNDAFPTACDPTVADGSTRLSLTGGPGGPGGPGGLVDCAPVSSPDWNIPSTSPQLYNHNTNLVDDTEPSIAVVESPDWRCPDTKSPVISTLQNDCKHSSGSPDWKSRVISTLPTNHDHSASSPDWKNPLISTLSDNGNDSCGSPDLTVTSPTSTIESTIERESQTNYKDSQLSRGVSHDQLHNINNNNKFLYRSAEQLSVNTTTVDCDHVMREYEQEHKFQQADKLTKLRAFSTEQLYHQPATVFASSDQLHRTQPQHKLSTRPTMSSSSEQLHKAQTYQPFQLRQPLSQSHQYKPLHQPLQVSHSTPTTVHCSRPSTLFHSRSTPSHTSHSDSVTPDVFTDDKPLTSTARLPLTGSLSTSSSTMSGRLPSTTLSSAVCLRQRPCSTSDISTRLLVSRHRSLLDSRSEIFDSFNRWQQRQQTENHLQSLGGTTLRKPVVTSRSQPVRALPLDSLTNKQLDVISEVKSPDKTTTTHGNKQLFIACDDNVQQQQQDTMLLSVPGSLCGSVYSQSVVSTNVPLSAPVSSVVPDVVSCSSVPPVFQSPVRRNSIPGRLESVSRDPIGATPTLRSRDRVSPPESRDYMSPQQRDTLLAPETHNMFQMTSQSRDRPQSLILYPEQYVSRDQCDSPARDRSQVVTHDVTERHNETVTLPVRSTLQLKAQSRDQTPAVLPWRRTLLVRSESMPIGGGRSRGTEAGKEVDEVVDELIPRTAMARFNVDGSPRSILKHTNTVQAANSHTGQV